MLLRVSAITGTEQDSHCELPTEPRVLLSGPGVQGKGTMAFPYLLPPCEAAPIMTEECNLLCKKLIKRKANSETDSLLVSLEADTSQIHTHGFFPEPQKCHIKRVGL